MKPAVPRYFELSAFGAQVKREHACAFRGRDGADAGIAQMLPQHVVARSPAMAAGGSAPHAPAVVEAGDEECQYIASAPFPVGCCVAYFEVQIEATAESAGLSDVNVSIGVEKRNLERIAPPPDANSYEQSSEDFDDTSDVEGDMSVTSDANMSLSAMWAGTVAAVHAADDEADAEAAAEAAADTESIEDSGLPLHEPSAVVSTLDRAAIWSWLWKLSSGVLVSAPGKRPLSHSDSQLSEPLKEPLRCPVRIGFGLDLVQDRILLTRDGNLVALYGDGDSHAKNKLSALGGGLALVPTLTVRNARVRPIFGDGNLLNDGFEFDIKAYADNTFRLLALSKEDEINGRLGLMLLLADYFGFYGYTKSERALRRYEGIVLSEALTATMGLRQQLREHIRNGNIARVYELLAEAGVQELSLELKFKLEFQAFVQLVRTSANIDRVLEEGRQLFSKYNAAADGEVRAKLEQASGLLVSRDRQDPAFEELYGSEAIHKLTTAVLGAVSEAQGLPSLPELERVFSETCANLINFSKSGDGHPSRTLGELTQQLGSDWATPGSWRPRDPEDEASD